MLTLPIIHDSAHINNMEPGTCMNVTLQLNTWITNHIGLNNEMIIYFL